MLDFFILLILIFVTVAFVSGNNLSVCVGPAVGSRILNRRMGAFLGSLGFSLGLILQGPAMVRSVEALLPNATIELRIEALIVILVIFIIALAFRVPVSLGMSIVGLFLGLSIARGLPTDTGFIVEVVLTWVTAPAIALGLAYYSMCALNKRWPENFWKRLQIYKIVLLVLSFSSSYVLGANTIGLVVATGGFEPVFLLISIIAVFIGSFFLSKGQINRITQELFLLRYPNAAVSLVTTTILVEVATLLNIPLSNTQITTAAVFGTGLSYKTKLVSLKPFLVIIIGWVMSPLLSFLIGMIII
jgi:PiT family inorganic phosphate transporter